MSSRSPSQKHSTAAAPQRRLAVEAWPKLVAAVYSAHLTYGTGTPMTLSRRDVLTASALLLAGPAAAARLAARESGGAKPLVLCWNENPYGPSPAARRVVSELIPSGCRYPSDEAIAALVAAIAAHESIGADHIITGTGSGELLRALGLLYGRDGGEIVAAQPSYTELTSYAGHRGARLKFVPLDLSMRHDLPAMRSAVSPATRAVYLCNPNNPTGTALTAAEIRAFVVGLPSGLLTIVDEAYMDFTTAPGVGSVADLVKSGSGVVVLRTFSKIHGMAGLRCGYAIASPEVIKAVDAAVMTTPNIFAVHAARASLGDGAFRAECRRRIVGSRTRITTVLSELKLRYAEPQGNFVFFDTGMPLPRFTELMRARDILVGRHFPPFDSWCRITVGTEPEVAAFLAALRAVLPTARQSSA
jgi:histidinol-phosphate aminotransferase